MSANHANHTPAKDRRERRRLYVADPVWWAVGIVLALAVSWHVSASMAYQRSFDRTLSIDQRASAAQFAAHIEPWDGRLAARALVVAKWQHGSVLVSQGAYLPAMLELADAYKLDVGDPELLALFQKAQRGLSISSNFKAHIQHGHEGPGATLRPQDLLP